MSAVEFGAPEGVAVVAVHGAPGSSDTFGVFDNAARKAGVRLIAVTRPGYENDCFEPVLDLDEWCDRFEAFLDDRGLTDGVSIIASSGAAPYVLTSANRSGSRVARIAVVAGMGDTSRRDQHPKMLSINRIMAVASDRSTKLAETLGGVIMALSRIAPNAFLKLGALTLPHADREELARPEESDPLRQVARQLGWQRGKAFARDFRIFGSGWSEQLDEHLTTEVRWFHGRLDRNVPISYAEVVCGRLEHGTLVTIADGGHILLHRVFDDVLTFLTT
jgi:pimeloyl-ACP methyl ester carboxylesterase